EGNATTEDLRKALEKASGQQLQDFFNRWIYGSGHPVYEWSSATTQLKGSGKLVTITLKQIQKGEAFLDPVPVEITSGGKKQLITIQPSGKLAVKELRVTDLPISIKVDPDQTLLRE